MSAQEIESLKKQMARTTRALSLTRTQRNNATDEVVALNIAVEELRESNAALNRSAESAGSRVCELEMQQVKDANVISELRDQVAQQELRIELLAKQVVESQSKTKKPRAAKTK